MIDEFVKMYANELKNHKSIKFKREAKFLGMTTSIKTPPFLEFITFGNDKAYAPLAWSVRR